MKVFPDLEVKMEDLTIDGPRVVYKWMLTGTNTGPDGTGKPVRISGYEEWRLTQNGLIAESQGHFDEAAYREQLLGSY